MWYSVWRSKYYNSLLSYKSNWCGQIMPRGLFNGSCNIYVHNSAHTSLFSPLECDAECCCGTYWPPEHWNYSRTELWPVSEVYMCTQYTNGLYSYVEKWLLQIHKIQSMPLYNQFHLSNMSLTSCCNPFSFLFPSQNCRWNRLCRCDHWTTGDIQYLNYYGGVFG